MYLSCSKKGEHGDLEKEKTPPISKGSKAQGKIM